MNAILEMAKTAAQRAGALLTAQLGRTTIAHKALSYDLVTGADRGSENIIREFLGRQAPEIAFYGEETRGTAELSADRVWIVDPLDGTTNFAHSIPHFGVSIAYAEKGVLRAGVVFDPCRGELFSAIAGKGAQCNGSVISVSKSAALNTSLIGTGFYYDRSETMAKTLRALHALFRQNIHCARRMGAATLDLAWLACGRFDGYFEYTLSPWDFAAGLLIVNEAGGMVSDPNGRQADLFSKGVICSNGLIHQELLTHTLNPVPFS
ncbi:MAG: inositol monophosphatase [Chitinispirillaceae bacterium]|jgi:myo-inositol-1(or 4)-monophosphatase|nr:inositol monophosphatase [Chitinispirillaceae bacterium]